MTRIRHQHFARTTIFIATIASALGFLAACETTQTETTAEEIPETVLITGSLVRGGGGASPWPQYSVPSGRRAAAPARPSALSPYYQQPNTEKYPDARTN